MGKLADIKTKETEADVTAFINTIEDETKRNDSFTLLKMMEKISGEKPKLWGAALIGFGKFIVKSPTTGREVEWMKIGFAPRKANFSLYLTGNIQKYDQYLQKLGKHKTGLGCLYIKKLVDVDMNTLEELVTAAMKKHD